MLTPEERLFLQDAKLLACLVEVVGKIGKGPTMTILHELSRFGDERLKPKERQKAIAAFIIQQTILQYQLEEALFFTSEAPEYRTARMVSIYLAREYGRVTRPQLEQMYQLKHYQLRYFETQMRDILSVPAFHKDLLAPARELETTIQKFVSLIDSTQ